MSDDNKSKPNWSTAVGDDKQDQNIAHDEQDNSADVVSNTKGDMSELIEVLIDDSSFTSDNNEQS